MTRAQKIAPSWTFQPPPKYVPAPIKLSIEHARCRATRDSRERPAPTPLVWPIPARKRGGVAYMKRYFPVIRFVAVVTFGALVVMGMFLVLDLLRE